jgi:hypothetical protein
MLNETQKIKLVEIRDSIKDERLKNLVTDAIEGWEDSKHKPSRFDIGVYLNKDGSELKIKSYGMCFIGAACSKKPPEQIRAKKPSSIYKYEYPYYINLSKALSLSEVKINLITSVFDHGRASSFFEDPDYTEFSEWIEVILKIREIVIDNFS